MCLCPNLATQYTNGNETYWVFGKKNHRLMPSERVLRRVWVPCGKCFECQLQGSSEWVSRCLLEASLYKDNCVLTLTYNNEHLPENGSVSRRDITLFLKRLRKAVGSFRYFGCAEYGSKGQRPHYHLIVFGWSPSDCDFFFNRDGRAYFLSRTVERVWGNGNILVNKDVDSNTVKYCCKYCQKLNDIGSKTSPFLLMSRMPALGFGAYKEKWLETDKVYPKNGFPTSTPRSFLARLARLGVDTEKVKVFRAKKSDVLFHSVSKRFLKRKEIYLKKLLTRLLCLFIIF